MAPATVVDPYSGYTVQTALKTNQTNYYVTAPANRWVDLRQGPLRLQRRPVAVGQRQLRADQDPHHPVPLAVHQRLGREHPLRRGPPGVAGAGDAAELAAGPDRALVALPDPRPERLDAAALDRRHQHGLADLRRPRRQGAGDGLHLGALWVARPVVVLHRRPRLCVPDPLRGPDLPAGLRGQRDADGQPSQRRLRRRAGALHLRLLRRDLPWRSAPSQDCINAISAKLQNQTFVGQNVVEFNTQGGPVQHLGRAGAGLPGRVPIATTRSSTIRTCCRARCRSATRWSASIPPPTWTP
ncbi:MAG: hypothetical protein WDM92_14230 [Caulobacteraceae bacterium]